MKCIVFAIQQQVENGKIRQFDDERETIGDIEKYRRNIEKVDDL